MQHTIVYENRKVLDYIVWSVDKVSHQVTNTEKLEAVIIKKVSEYLAAGYRSFTRIKLLIHREINAALNKWRIQQSVYFSGLTSQQDDGATVEFEPVDALASVEESVIQKSSVNEKIARLATGDRELVTLNGWKDGLTDTQISETLASLYGGKIASHCRYIRRFREKCQRKLTA